MNQKNGFIVAGPVMQQRLMAGRDGTLRLDLIEDHCLILPAELQICFCIGGVEVSSP
jgi:hypothetical protein